MSYLFYCIWKCLMYLHYYIFPPSPYSVSLSLSEKTNGTSNSKASSQCSVLSYPVLYLYIPSATVRTEAQHQSVLNIPHSLAQLRVHLTLFLHFCDIVISVNRLNKKFTIYLQTIISAFVSYLPQVLRVFSQIPSSWMT